MFLINKYCFSIWHFYKRSLSTHRFWCFQGRRKSWNKISSAIKGYIWLFTNICANLIVSNLECRKAASTITVLGKAGGGGLACHW